MTETQIVFIAAAVLTVVAWSRLPSLRALLRLMPVAALVMFALPLFTRFPMPSPMIYPALLGAGIAAGIMSLR
jgi:hypothetical protein